MLIIKQRAYARAGLIGNPSDGYHGKTISVIVRDFYAQAVLYEWDEVEVVWSQEERNRFRSVGELVHDVRLHGYYGGVRLVKATIKKFVEFCQRQGFPLDDRTFAVRYETNIPRAVGLAGSSAIIVATLRALMQFYGVDIPRDAQPSLALSVETEELGIAAGLQDRVIQVFEGAVYMDFAVENARTICGLQCGLYEPLDPALLPPLYVAYDANLGEPTEIVHNDLRTRFRRGDPDVVQAMRTFADLAAHARQAILNRDYVSLAALMNENFDTRRSICRLAAGQIDMIERARAAGASAKFAGSGGAIIGTYPDEPTYGRLCEALATIGCRVIRVAL